MRCVIDPRLPPFNDSTCGFALLRGLKIVWINQIAEKQGYFTDSKIINLLAKAKKLGLPKIEIEVKGNMETRVFEIHFHRDSSVYGVTYRGEEFSKDKTPPGERMKAMRSIIHDIRNPLSVIHTTVELLHEDASEEDRRDLEIMLKKTREINELLELLPALVEK